MAKTGLLEDITIRKAKPKASIYMMRDGNGLFVLVHPNGSKYFQLRTTLHSKAKLVALGVYPVVTLAEARKKALEAKRQTAQGDDPIIEAKLKKEKSGKDANATFKVVASEWLEIRKRNLAASTHKKIVETFNANVYRQIGDYPIATITYEMIRNCLLIMQNRGALELMGKTRQWIKNVFDFALNDSLIQQNPIQATDAKLMKHEGEHFPHFTAKNDTGKFLRNLTDYAGSIEVSTCALLMMNLAQRPSELRCAKWADFNLDQAIGLPHI